MNNKQATKGDGHTQFGQALYELNIESICANSSQAKGRVERANSTLQDRLVKELRLQGISTMAAANAFTPAFIANFNRRFAQPPRNDLNVHRLLRDDEELDFIITVREPRKVSHSLTLQYDKVIYMLENTPPTRKLIGQYINVLEYPVGRIEIRANGITLPYSSYDRLSEIDQGAIVENKRLGHVLQVAQIIQEQRVNRRGRSASARTDQGLSPVKLKQKQVKKHSGNLMKTIWLKQLKQAALNL